MEPPESRSRIAALDARPVVDAAGQDVDEAPSMPDAASARVLVVRDAAAARMLVRPSGLRRLEPFMGAPRTVGDVARSSGEKPNTVLRRVGRLLDLGLLEVEFQM